MIAGNRKLFHPQPYSPLFSMLSKRLPILALVRLCTIHRSHPQLVVPIQRR
uniref:Uncharacterized protein n=1 Tax=Picea glauca TaxID=3330 RepID=A0A101M5K4_PICGL|nr:hypothetical protein ABT39_MTgene1235 [Picea glauca]QHR92381.1 hypothetical protein Q903MT_gene6424 [Picea sitchensis]